MRFPDTTAEAQIRTLVTGAANGIGAATARALADRGADVVGVDICPMAGVTRAIEADLSAPDSAVLAALADAGPFDALINCAGLPPRADNAVDVLSLNALSLRAVTDAVLPALSPGGAIVNLASKAGEEWARNIDEVRALRALRGPADLPGFVRARGIDPLRAYMLSKEAVIVDTFARTEALKERHLRANCVSPAAVDTGILDDFVIALGDRAKNGLRLAGRAGHADEIAAVVVFLASPQSAWIKGQDVRVDGGLTAMLTARDLAL